MARPRKLYHRTSFENLTETIMEELNFYAEDVIQGMLQICRKLADEAIEMLEMASPVGTGEYADKWTRSIETLPGEPIKLVIHNKKYQLTHLLEFGHATIDGGRVEGQPHIAKVQDWINEEFVARTEAMIEGL